MNANDPAVVVAFEYGKREGKRELQKALLELLGAFDLFATKEPEDSPSHTGEST